MPRHTDTIALVTGAAHGIGRSRARKLGRSAVGVVEGLGAAERIDHAHHLLEVQRRSAAP